MKKVVIYGVLNWGLGHATRSIPIIRSFINLGYTPILCSDGDALALLQAEFPLLETISLPAYRIQYKYRSMVANVSLYGLGILKTIFRERTILQNLVEKYDPQLIISDNRYGFYHEAVQSIIITHQLRIPAETDWQSSLASNFLHTFINKFDQCWVPDSVGRPNLSGKLSHDVALDIPIEYIGALSRFSRSIVEPKYDLAFVLSGPEPQRTYLEQKIIEQSASLDQKCILVRGTELPFEGTVSHMEVIDLADSERLQELILASRLVVSRAGYTTIMDLVALQKPAILIPTPGQPEQEYLAKHLGEGFTGFQFVSQEQLDLGSLLSRISSWGDVVFDSSWSDDRLGRLVLKG